jgi:HK97 family phage major capsid protein
MAKDLFSELDTLHGKVKTYTGRVLKDQRDMQKQLDGIDARLADRHVAQPTQKSALDMLKENEDVSRLIRDRKGHVVLSFKGEEVTELMEQKTTIALSGQSIATPGVVTIERMPGIVLEARRRLTIRQLLTARPTTAGLIYYVKVNSPLTVASPQVETYAKTENAVTFTVGQATVKTIATWIPASKQALDDVTELDGFLRASLPYYVNRLEETQLLSGDGQGENLNGLITQSTAFNTALLNATDGWTRIDQIGAAIEQIALIDEVPPSFVALNPHDLWQMRRTKDNFGRYILGDPQSVGSPTIWDLTPVSTNSVVAGTFLVGGGDPAQCEIRDRMEMQVEISTEHADYFTRNLIAIRAEKRLALIVQRPQSFIHGTFSTSPQ